MKSSKLANSKKNDKINCDISNCMYHQGATSCTASKIKVGADPTKTDPQKRCNCSEQTCCASFKERNRP